MRVDLKSLIGTALILGVAAIGCARIKLPPRQNIPPYISYDVRTLIEELYSPGTKRVYAAYYLGEMGQRAVPAIPYLIKILGDDTQVKKTEEELLDFLDRTVTKSFARVAAAALIKIGSPAREPLIKALNDEGELVGSWAGLALNEINSNRYVRKSAASALGGSGDMRAVEPLIEALKDEDYLVRGDAASALGVIGDPRAIEHLITALMDDDASRVRWRATRAMANMGAPAVEPLMGLLRNEDSRVRERAAEALSKIGAPAVEPLVTALENEVLHIRKVVVPILERIGAPAVEPLIATLKDGDFAVRYDAVKALGSIKDCRAVEHLIPLLEDSNPDMGKKSAEALGRIGDRRAVEPLITVLKNDEDYHKEVRDWASWALGEIKDPRAVEPLIAALKDEKRLVQRSAADALGKIGKPAIEILAAALKDKDSRTRGGAATALEMIGWQAENDLEKAWFLVASQKFGELVELGMPAVKPLTIILEKDKDWRIRKKAAWALEGIDDWEPENTIEEIQFLIASRRLTDIDKFGAQAVEPLILALRDKSPVFRENVARALGKIGWPAVKPLVSTLKDQDWSVRRKAVETLGRIADNRALGSLVAALNDKDWYVRGKVAEALGDIGDFEAAESLVPMLKDKNSSVRENAAKALDDLWWSPRNGTDSVWFLIAYRKWDEISRFGRLAVKPLTTVSQDEDYSIRKKVSETLAKIDKIKYPLEKSPPDGQLHEPWED